MPAKLPAVPTRPHRQHRLTAAAALLAVLSALAILPAGAQTMRADEGEWQGYISFTGFTLQGEAIPVAGGFTFTSAGGAVDGTFEWTNSEGQYFAGQVTGPDTMPQFVMTQVIVNGVDIPDVQGGGEIQFTAATCERLEGVGVNILAPVPDPADQVWWAIRTDAAGGGDPTALLEAFAALSQQVDLLIDDIEEGRVILTVAYADLEAAIAESNRLASELDRSAGCGLEFYRSVTASEVGRLLDYLLATPDVPVFVLAQTLVAAAGAGVIGAGAEEGPSNYDAGAQAVVAERIEAAIASENTVDLLILAALAEDMGWTDLAATAGQALAELGP